MASFIQTNVPRHSLYLPKVSQPCCQNSAPLHVSPLPCANGSSMKSLKYNQQFAPILKHRRRKPVVNYWNGPAVCLLDGKDKSEKDKPESHEQVGKVLPVEEDASWLERDIINTRTWFDSPENYKEIFRSWEFLCSSMSKKQKMEVGVNFPVTIRVVVGEASAND